MRARFFLPALLGTIAHAASVEESLGDAIAGYSSPTASTPGRNYGDVFTAETVEGAEVFGQDRRDIVMSIRTPLEFRRKKGRSEAKSKGSTSSYL